ncbi:hypothetical protein OIU84_027783 [Salix udensis]|uniref:Uncharacterized protein n=1 Tax=Salix udensis TaxID=889485 RepID=A0AAD6KI93_9ROSI|nr:hypothetical protein OIU84_027783 [Salix udensis]
MEFDVSGLDESWMIFEVVRMKVGSDPDPRMRTPSSRRGAKVLFSLAGSSFTHQSSLKCLLRSGKSCRLRWINYLRPDLKRGNFSDEEDELIINLHSLLGNKWSLIAARLPGRTDNEIKNYWNTHIKRNSTVHSTPPPPPPPLQTAPTPELITMSNIIKVGGSSNSAEDSNSSTGVTTELEVYPKHKLNLELSIGLPCQPQPSSINDLNDSKQANQRHQEQVVTHQSATSATPFSSAPAVVHRTACLCTYNRGFKKSVTADSQYRFYRPLDA